MVRDLHPLEFYAFHIILKNKILRRLYGITYCIQVFINIHAAFDF